MRKSRTEAAETRRKIVATAASAFGSSGIQATAVSDIMSAAGLSHGGFYRHFESKDQLVAEACAEGMKSAVESARTAAGECRGPKALHEAIERYLSPDHVDNRTGGCPLSLMGSELARADDQARTAAIGGFQDLVEVFASQYRDLGRADYQERALFTVSAMVGAVTISRIALDPKLAGDILKSTERQLVAEALGEG